ncbi:MAG: hypothetical protein WCO22_18090 [Betaproteobacteria bacterium]
MAATEFNRWAPQVMRVLHTLALLLLSLCACMVCINAFASSTVNEQEESQIIQSIAPFAKREGKTLFLNLYNKRRIKLTDTGTCGVPENCLIYRFLGISPDRNFFVVEGMGYESRTVFWFARNSGLRHEVFAKPEISPDGKSIITANPSEQGSNNGVFIWELRRDRLINKLHFEPTDYALYSFVRWEGANKVTLKKFTYADKSVCPSAQFMEFFVTVNRNGTQWFLNESNGLKEVFCQ